MIGGDTNPDKPSVSIKISTNEASIRKITILLICDEFCERFSDYTFFKNCTHLIRDLVNPPQIPFLAGRSATLECCDHLSASMLERESDPAWDERISAWRGDFVVL